MPVIASGGMGAPEDLLTVVFEGGADGVAMAHILHYKHAEISDIRKVATQAKMNVRVYDPA